MAESPFQDIDKMQKFGEVRAYSKRMERYAKELQAEGEELRKFKEEELARRKQTEFASLFPKLGLKEKHAELFLATYEGDPRNITAKLVLDWADDMLIPHSIPDPNLL